MTSLLTSLIYKQDEFEVIRDQIALILVNEVANQMSKATDAGKDPALWNLNVYTERGNPWEQFLNAEDAAAVVPVVNIWVDDSSFNDSASNICERQDCETTYNIDCYGFGVSKDDGGTGHIAGDKEAAFECQRAVRLVRNILMAAHNSYLQLRGRVGRRYVRNINFFQPERETHTVQQVIGGRIQFIVRHNEFAPENAGGTLELVSVDIKRAEDGKVIAEADFEYPLP